MADAYSIFEYLYRDASNYKVFGEVLLAGRVTDSDLKKIQSKIASDGVFVPEFVGLKPLQEGLEGYPSADDHIWHEFVDLRPARLDEAVQDAWGRLSLLVENFLKLPNWDSDEMLRRVKRLLASGPLDGRR